MIPSQCHRFKLLAIAAFAGTCGIAGASAFHIDVGPLFTSVDGVAWDRPVAIDIQNDGPDAKGVVHVNSYTFSMDYPVVLRHGSSQRLIAYPTSEIGELRVTLDTDQGSETKNLFGYGTSQGSYESSWASCQVLMIGDRVGALSFLRNRRQGARLGSSASDSSASVEASTIADSYCTPEGAPPRPIGYSSIRAVVLGTGAERLSDASIDAIKTWTLEGGTLVFIGKESSPILADARWQSALPATHFTATTVKTSDALASIGQQELPGAVPLLEPDGVHGVAVRADGSTVISTESGFGAGRVVYLAFDPMSEPLNEWAGRGTAMTEVLRPGFMGEQQSLVAHWSSEDNQNGTTSPMDSPYRTTAAGGVDDPFSATLPPSSQVFEVLAAYFLAVIPLNFLILRKFKRAELAWFTAPLLSLGFASVLFRSAGNLYSQKLSTATQGVVLVRPGVPWGVFVGDTTMFIPKGGRYDLAMNRVDNIGTIDQPSFDPLSRPSSRDFELNPVDSGEVTVPNMLASNLAFRQIHYRQEVPLANLYSISMHRSGANAVCEVKNGGKSALNDAFVFVGKHIQSVGRIEAGESKTVVLDLTKSAESNVSGPPTGTMDSTLGYYGGAALQATLSGFRPGPQIGEQVDARSQVTLLVFSKDALGGIR